MIDNVAKDAFVAARPDRIRTVSEDFFREVPGGADLYLLKFILQRYHRRCR